MQVHACCGYSHFLKSERPISSLQLQSYLFEFKLPLLASFG